MRPRRLARMFCARPRDVRPRRARDRSLGSASAVLLLCGNRRVESVAAWTAGSAADGHSWPARESSWREVAGPSKQKACLPGACVSLASTWGRRPVGRGLRLRRRRARPGRDRREPPVRRRQGRRQSVRPARPRAGLLRASRHGLGTSRLIIVPGGGDAADVVRKPRSGGPGPGRGAAPLGWPGVVSPDGTIPQRRSCRGSAFVRTWTEAVRRRGRRDVWRSSKRVPVRASRMKGRAGCLPHVWDGDQRFGGGTGRGGVAGEAAGDAEVGAAAGERRLGQG